MYRFGRYAASLCVSASLVAVSNYVLRADVPRVTTGTWAAAGEVAVPGGASSVALADGRVVVAGGESDGVPSSAISTYDPPSGAWARIGDLATPRSAHATTVLKDGRVLVVGGTASNGPTLDVEIFDPVTGTSVHAGDMLRPRFDHAAATLEDGRVLIVGGSDGAAPMNLAEIFDPATGQSVGVPNVMATARVRATATTLLDGHVLVVGGNDGTGDLSSAEIFDPATLSFFNTGAMQTARSSHVAVLLPDNNQVLIAGGMSAAAAVASAELYADWRDGFAPTPNPMSVARGGGIAAGLQPYDVAFVAGGGANTAEYYGYATVKTDKDDYAPYETVTISGSGWQPGEKVRLRVSEDADTHYDWELEAIADESGNIVNRDFYPRNDEVYHHIGMRFYLTAVGIGSQALTTFTDAMQTETSLASSLNPSPAGQSVTFTATVRMNDKHGNTDDWKPAVGGSVNFYDRTTATDACDKNNGNYGVLLGSSAVNAGQATFSRVFASAGTYPIQACYRGTGGQGTQDSFSGVIQQQVTSAGKTAITVTADAKSKTYGDNDPALTYTITSGALASGDSFTGSLARVAGENVGTYAINQGTLSAGSNYTLTFVPANLTIDARPVTVTVDTKSKTYGDNDPALTFTGALQGPDSFTGNLVRDAGENVGTYAIKQGTLSAGSNYAITFVGANLTINARPVTVTADAKSKTYGDNDPALTYTITSGAVANGDSFTGSLARVAGENVGTYAINQGTLSAGSNYTLTFVAANLTISARPVTVTADAKSKTYGDNDPALTYTGALHGSDSFTGNLVRDAGENVGTYAINQGTLSAGSNYTLTYVGANLTINARPVTVTADAKSKTYGDADPALTYTGALHGTDSFTGNLVRDTGENVGTYAINQGTLSAGSNYTLTYVGANLTINARPVTVTADAKSKTYGDDDPALTYSGTLHGTDSFTGNLVRDAGENVGPYAIKQGTLSAGSNYTLTFVGANLTISARPVTVTANPQSKVYGEADPELTYSGVLHGSDSFTGSLVRDVGENVGTYAINQGTLTAGSNYALTFEGANLTITARPVTVTADAKTKTYGEADPELTYTGVLHGSDSFSGSLVRDAGENVGSYAINQGTLSAGSNYTLTYVGANLTINARPVTVTADAKSKTYGDADPALTYTGVLHGSDSFSGNLVRDAGENVGTYAIKQGTLSAGSNYTLTFVPANLTINARPVTVTADAKSKTYGDSDPALTYTAVLHGTDSFMGSLERVPGENVGTYAINQGTLSAGSNYALTFVGATLTINARPVTVTANPQTKVYGDADPELTYTGVLHGSDNFTGNLARAAGENVGAYAINQGALSAGSNYALTFVPANLTISKATLTVTADDKSRPYGDPNPSLTATFTGFKFAESLATAGVTGSPALATAATQPSPVGEYVIAVGPGTLASGNYAFAYVNGTLTVTKASLTVMANDASRPYGVANPAFSGSYYGQKNGDTFTMSFTTSATTVSPVGSYAIVPSASGPAIDNYDVTPVSGTLTVAAWSLRGFYQPVGETSSIVSGPAVQPVVSGATVWNSIKGGQTVPLKFNIYRAVGGAPVTSVMDAFAGAGFSAYQLPSCSGGNVEDEIALGDLSTGGTELRWDGTQFIQNWKTPKVSGGDLCFRAVITAKDGSTITAFFKVKK